MLASGLAEGGPAPAEMLVWNATDLEESALRAMGGRLGVPVRLCRLPEDLSGLECPPVPANCNPVPAAALVLAHASDQPLPLDFLHSRLAVRKPPRFGRLAIWGAVAAVAVIAAGVWIFLEWRSSWQEVDKLKSDLAGMSVPLQQAKDVVDKATFVRGWYDRRPRYLDCLKELANAFPEDRIWATNVTIKEDMHVVLQGKAGSEAAVLEVLTRLKGNPRLTDVKSMGIRLVGGSTREVSFVINFTLAGAS